MWCFVLLALLYGAVEGITEWLPVSSTGHLILLRHFLPFSLDDAFFELFEVAVQCGAILAVPVLFFRELFPFFGKRSREERLAGLCLWGKILLAVLPAAAVGVLFDDAIDRVLFRVPVVAAALIFYGIFFLFAERGKNTPRITRLADLRVRDALGIGLFQVLALVPGTSRSGATVLGGILLGISRPVAASFSFFLGIPTMLGAGFLKGIKLFLARGALAPTEWLMLGVGVLTAFLVSLVVIRFLMDFVKRHTFAVFGVYRILLGACLLLILLF